MENKYYTPKIEEFHIGFELEFKNNMQDNVWKHQICDADLISLAFDSIEHKDTENPFSEEFRVKYLDDEDIINCGWKKEFQLENIIRYNDNTHNKNNILFFTPQYNHIRILNTEEKIKLFDGKIKNKSELKILLNQLKIKL